VHVYECTDVSIPAKWAGENWTFGAPGTNRTAQLVRLRQRLPDGRLMYLCPYRAAAGKKRRNGEDKFAFKVSLISSRRVSLSLFPSLSSYLIFL
jgi:hypothetical protein